MDAAEALEVLGVGSSAVEELFSRPPEEAMAAVRQLFKKLGKKMHPDKHGGTREATERFRRIKEAYEVAKDAILSRKEPEGKRKQRDLGRDADIRSVVDEIFRMGSKAGKAGAPPPPPLPLRLSISITKKQYLREGLIEGTAKGVIVAFKDGDPERPIKGDVRWDFLFEKRMGPLQRIRLPRQGHMGANGERGDIEIELSLRMRGFELRGNDIVLEVPLGRGMPRSLFSPLSRREIAIPEGGGRIEGEGAWFPGGRGALVVEMEPTEEEKRERDREMWSKRPIKRLCQRLFLTWKQFERCKVARATCKRVAFFKNNDPKRPVMEMYRFEVPIDPKRGRVHVVVLEGQGHAGVYEGRGDLHVRIEAESRDAVIPAKE